MYEVSPKLLCALVTDLMEHGDPVLGHVDVDDGPRLHEQLPQQRVAHLLVQPAHVDRRILDGRTEIMLQTSKYNILKLVIMKIN